MSNLSRVLLPSALTALALSLGCTSTSPTMSSGIHGGVLVAGTSTNDSGSAIPGVWANGTWVPLALPAGMDSGTVGGMASDGDDLYVAGGVSASGVGPVVAGRPAPLNGIGLFDSVPGYWLNGAWASLPLGLATSGTVNSVVVSGDDVYIGGDCYFPGGVQTPGYWMNGAWTGLPVGAAVAAVATSLVVSGTDVYLGGLLRGADQTTYIPGYWENGLWNPLEPLAMVQNQVNAIAVSGANVYVAGFSMDSFGENTYPGCWTNRTWAALPFPSLTGYNFGTVTGLFLSGSDVYAAGYCSDSGIAYTPGYWKNGIWHGLVSGPGAAYSSQTGSIFVSGTDVYVTGICSSTPGSGFFPAQPGYWKNGIWTALPALDSTQVSRLAAGGSIIVR